MIKWVLNCSKSLFFDSHLNAHGSPAMKIKTLINISWRYRLASCNFSVTKNERRLSSFRNFHRGQQVFIIGNGRSLNNCDLTLLKTEITFGVNAIYLNYEKMELYNY